MKSNVNYVAPKSVVQHKMALQKENASYYEIYILVLYGLHNRLAYVQKSSMGIDDI